MMTTILLRYQTKAERADENQQRIEAAFAELCEHQPEGFTYKVFRSSRPSSADIADRTASAADR
jgi:hypothetical protein